MCSWNARQPRWVLFAPAWSVLLFTSGIAVPAGAQPTLTNLGVLDGGNFSYATAVSADGLVVCGSSTSSGGQRAFRWTESGGMISLGALSGFTNYSTASAISADGSVIAGGSVGAGNAARGFRWTSGTGLQSISVLGTGLASYALGISADGSVIAGSSYTASLTGIVATRWTSASGLQSLGGSYSDGRAISADGLVIVGSEAPRGGETEAMRWTSNGGIQHLNRPVGTIAAWAYATSADGSAVAGGVVDGNSFNEHAAIWTGLPGGGGAVQILGTLDGSDVSSAFAISGDGGVVGGFSALPNDYHAFVWTSSLGMVDLNVYLPLHGVDLTGWTLQFVRGISFDGTAVVGEGTFNGALRAFLIRGLILCGNDGGSGDGNSDGMTNGLDIAGIVNSLIAGAAGSTGACVYDMNQDGLVSHADIPIFITTLFGS